MKTRFILFCSLLTISLVACGASPASDVSKSSTLSEPAEPKPLMVSNGTLTLVIFSPLDQAVVTEQVLDILGSISIDAVLTLKGERYILPPGEFKLSVSLEPGPNILDFHVSSLFGSEVELNLNVTYQP